MQASRLTAEKIGMIGYGSVASICKTKNVYRLLQIAQECIQGI
jgi:hypothetical protein